MVNKISCHINHSKTAIPICLGLGIIVLLGILIYSNSFNCSFHLDDTNSIVDNMKIRNLSDVKAIWNHSQTRFIAYYSFALNYHFGNLNVWGYHLVNLIIHLINACLVYWLTLLIFSSPALKDHTILKNKSLLAFITAILFVSHPLATQSVTYIVQRMASMVALFYLLSLALYIKGRLTRKSTSLKYILFAGAFISAILAMLTKENSFTLPFAIVLVEIFFLQTKKLSINFKDYRTILIVAGFLGFILIVLFTFSFNIFNPIHPNETNDYRLVTSQGYLFTQFSVIVKYIQLLFLPIIQNLDYDFPISNSFFELSTILSFLFLSSLIILAIFVFKKNRILSFGIFWFFLTLSIESSIIPISDLIFEHRTYLPSFGFFLILSLGIYVLLWNKYKYIAIVVFAILIGSNSYFTYERNKVWKDDLTLFSDVILKSPNKARGYYNRGTLFRDNNRQDEALKDYNKAIALNPDFTQAYNNRGNIFLGEKRIEEAHKDFNKAIALNPNFAEAYINRGTLFLSEKRIEEAHKDFNKAIKLNPNYAQAYNNLGTLFLNEKQNEDALKNYNKAIELNPDYGEAYVNRGIVKFNTGKKDSACIDFQKAVGLGMQLGTEMYNKYCR